MHWLILIKGSYWWHQLTFTERLEYLLISVKGWNICLHLPKVVQVYLCHKDVLAYLCQRLCRFIDVLAYLCKMFVLACLCQKDVLVYLCQRLYRLTFAKRLLSSYGWSRWTSPSCSAADLRMSGVDPVSSNRNNRSNLETFQMVLAEWKWWGEVKHEDWLHSLLSCIVSCMKMFEQRERQRKESNRQKMRQGTGC